MTVERVQDRTEEFVGKLRGDLENIEKTRMVVMRLEIQLFGHHVQTSCTVAKYGIEMVMPRGSSGKSFAEMDILDAKEKRQLKNYALAKSTIDMLEKIALIKETEEDAEALYLYNLALSEMSIREIALETNIHRRTVTKKIENILRLAIRNETIETWLIYGVVDTFD